MNNKISVKSENDTTNSEKKKNIKNKSFKKTFQIPYNKFYNEGNNTSDKNNLSKSEINDLENLKNKNKENENLIFKI